MAVALLTPYLTPYRLPLFERLAQRDGLEVFLYGGGERYAPAWFRDLDSQLRTAPFTTHRLRGPQQAFGLARRYDALIAPFGGGTLVPAAFAGTRARQTPFVLWASVWAQPRSLGHYLALPMTRRIYRRADAVIAYGEHVRAFVAPIRGRDSDVFVAPQSVEPELFARTIAPEETDAFRAEHDLGAGKLVLYCGRLVAEKGIEVLLDAWHEVAHEATLVVIGDGPLAPQARAAARVRVLGALPRDSLPVAYAASECVIVPSIPTPRFREPWGLVCNEAMHRGRPLIASNSVGAVAGGLVRDAENAIVVPSGDVPALRAAIERMLADDQLRAELGAAAREAVAPYTYDAMVAAFELALAAAGVNAGARA